MQQNLGRPLLKSLLVSMGFGVAALLIVVTNLSVPIPGTGYLTDPREIFTVVGSALGGPLGAIIIGILAGIAVPGGVALASMLSHIASGLMVAWAYRFIVYRRQHPLAFSIIWMATVFIYYYLLLIPIFIFLLKLFNHDPSAYTIIYARLAQGVIPEVILTAIVTLLVVVALPHKTRKPSW